MESQWSFLQSRWLKHFFWGTNPSPLFPFNTRLQKEPNCGTTTCPVQKNLMAAAFVWETESRASSWLNLNEFKSLLLTSEGWRTLCIVILFPEAVKVYPGGIWSLLLELVKYFFFCRTISRFNIEYNCTNSTRDALSSVLHLRLPVILIHSLGTQSGGVCETPQSAEETYVFLVKASIIIL